MDTFEVAKRLEKWERWFFYTLKTVIVLVMLFGTFKWGYHMGFAKAMQMAMDYMASQQQPQQEEIKGRDL
jgi:hypothetical protein